jgi:hypothetical protein
MNLLLKHKTIRWPDIPQRVPTEFGLSGRRDFRAKQLFALALIAQGYSLMTEIRTLIAWMYSISPGSGSTYRAVASLGELVDEQNLRLKDSRSITLSVVSLSEPGRKLCHTLGWSPYEGEWERMRRLHEKGKHEPKHTCATLAFAYQARLRGYRAGVMPSVDAAGQFKPDAFVVQAEKSVFVEIELGYGKLSKWRNMAAHQGLVAICTNSVTHRKALKRECRSLHLPGCSTDLRTLFLSSRQESPSPLWLDEWE